MEIVIPSLEGIAFSRMYPSLFEDVEYVPIHSISEGERLETHITTIKSFLYTMVVPELSSVLRAGRISEFCNIVATTNGRHDSHWHRAYHATVDTPAGAYIGNKGAIYHVTLHPEYKVTPLMTIAVKKNQLFNLTRTETNADKFVLVIDKQFRNPENEIHFRLYRNMKRLFIDLAEPEIDIVYTNDLIKTCFSPVMQPPRFNTFDEMRQHSTSINEALIRQIRSGGV